MEDDVSRGRGSATSGRRRATVRPSLDNNDLIYLLHGSDSVKVELNRLENEIWLNPLDEIRPRDVRTGEGRLLVCKGSLA
ncbi:hypothetical protein Tco_0750330 [Tanacetum coccineum]|uniref:Uncharacterized protein n=1 Tax=Tanacetum coccineum TaxID=301880 RepID=A0ABQ4Z0Z6_9ASTR